MEHQVVSNAAAAGVPAAPIRTDTCVFVLRRGTSVVYTYALCHVDDIVLAFNDASLAADVKRKLSTRLEFNKVGPLRCFNGIQVEPDATGGVFLHQERFARELLAEFGFTDATPRRVPLDDHCAPLPRTVDEPECSVGRYHSVSASSRLTALSAAHADAT